MDKPIICKDKIHCGGDCPNLNAYGDEYDFTAKCVLSGKDLMWHDYWIAECDVPVDEVKK